MALSVRLRVKRKEYRLFGERKTLRAWANDPRCGVTLELLRDLLEGGMSLKSAMIPGSVPQMSKKKKGSKKYAAFGEEKSLIQWAEDPRCDVTIQLLRKRVAKGVALETAMTAERLRKSSQMYTAFGETKSIAEWVADARCSAASPGALLRRMRLGATLEEAISTDFPVRYEAFGERKTLFQWSKDARCTVNYYTVLKRLERGMTLETALAPREKVVHEKERKYPLHRAFGEARTMRQWLQDPRCLVTRFVLERRLARGMELEQAMSMPSKQKWVLTAFGETKVLTNWVKDERCVVIAKKLMERMEEGWDAERALTESVPGAKTVESSVGKLFAFGEWKRMSEWARDERCEVTYNQLRKRILEGSDVEAAMIRQLATPGLGSNLAGYLSAYGEAKRLSGWARDERCVVPYQVLRRRVCKGEDLESAMSRLGSKLTGDLSAFGETKRLSGWARDERCVVTYQVLRGRVIIGEDLESAMSRPARHSRVSREVES